MSNTTGYNASPQQGYMPALPPQALASVRTRRIIAVVLDLILVSLIACVIFLALGFVTLGLSWIFLPPVILPVVAFFYNGLTVSGANMATPGMKAMDLEVRMMNGQPAPFINAAMHGVLYWLSWYLTGGLVLLTSLVTSEKRCLHDILAGLVVVRRTS
ncbi:MAG: RDD family protein [Rhodoblastus sp.]